MEHNRRQESVEELKSEEGLWRREQSIKWGGGKRWAFALFCLNREMGREKLSLQALQKGLRILHAPISTVVQQFRPLHLCTFAVKIPNFPRVFCSLFEYFYLVVNPGEALPLPGQQLLPWCELPASPAQPPACPPLALYTPFWNSCSRRAGRQMAAAAPLPLQPMQTHISQTPHMAHHCFYLLLEASEMPQYPEKAAKSSWWFCHEILPFILTSSFPPSKPRSLKT